MTAARTFSGVQPTGSIHLGNYLGAIHRFARLQDTTSQALYCVVDLHAITMPQDPMQLRINTRTVAAAFLAAGIDPAKSIIFAQSRVRQHTELAWILNCVARVGWLERMTQFKDKAGENSERESVGLYAYPILMAADILLYRATHVPVGSDQKQHLELARDIAARFNKDFKNSIRAVTKTEQFFLRPHAVISDGPESRVMSLQDATKKMSKSDPNGMATINLLDTADEIAKKVKRAQSDSDTLPGLIVSLDERPAARNLVSIYAALKGIHVVDALGEVQGMQFSTLKGLLTDLLVSEIVPVGTKMRELLADPQAIDAVLYQGAARASNLAEETMQSVRQIVGYL
ncbi:MAG: tryptophan--tRNA ligase [Verrucomicrobiaceae bacterium]|nr:MAG: tryptophan--tRNA ligase [Verrucomicrobiaceae bacterium]